MSNSVQALYFTALRQKYDAEQQGRQRSGKFNDSQAGSCLRKRVLSRAGLEKMPPDDYELAVFERGNSIHNEFQRLFAGLGNITKDADGHDLMEYTLEDDHTIGRLDIVVDGLLTDFKTQKLTSFQFLQREGHAKEEHILQVGRYWRKLSLKGISLRGARLIYIPRGDAPDKPKPGKEQVLPIEFVVPLTIDVEAKVEEDLSAERNAWSAYQADGTLPAPLSLVPTANWQCRYCSYAKHCGTAYQAVNKYYNDDVKFARVQ